jgi:alkylresorcinol/alkylpyrone synthase
MEARLGGPPAAVRFAALCGLGAAVPAGRFQGELWDEFFADHYGGDELARQIWMNAGVDYRHGVADPMLEDVREWGTRARMERFLETALPLGREALERCLDDARVTAEDVGLLTVVSCTGYATPGLDILLARDLGMSAGVQRLHVGHMGCYAAVPGLAAVSDAAVARGKVGAMLCLELPSLHIQPPTGDVEQMVAHALFADAAVAALVSPARSGLELLDVVARTDSANAGMMTWDVTDQGFRMGLSPAIPAVLERHVGDVVRELLEPHGLCPGAVAAWAVHPGGPRILDVIAERVGLEEEDLAESSGVLHDYGNCSSATVLLVLQRIIAERALEDGDHVVCMAFGPGLTLYAALLRHRTG